MDMCNPWTTHLLNTPQILKSITPSQGMWFMIITTHPQLQCPQSMDCHCLLKGRHHTETNGIPNVRPTSGGSLWKCCRSECLPTQYTTNTECTE